MWRAASLAVASICVIAAPAAAQNHDPEIMQTVEAAYSGISANEGEARDWPAFNALFLPDAQLISVRGNAQDGFQPRAYSAPEWIVRNMGSLEGRGFVEDFVHYRIESYGPIAHAFTTWVTRSERGGAVNGRGAATLQVVNTQDGWRIANWIWTGEQEGLPLPE